MDSRLNTLSKAACDVFRRIGEGQLLRVPDDGGQAYMVNTNRCHNIQDEIAVSAAAVAELLKSDCLHALAPERVSARNGWKELGVFGYGCKLYCLAQ